MFYPLPWEARATQQHWGRVGMGGFQTPGGPGVASWFPPNHLREFGILSIPTEDSKPWSLPQLR